ncbi:MAG: hypothetical protein IJT65_03400 [Eubacterium sp.]|nr:hypothetical protein [Eubacterium sp.]
MTKVNGIKIKPANRQKEKNKKLIAAFYLIPFIIFMLEFVAFYPGGYISDLFDQFCQATGKTGYNDWHPVYHTLLAYKLPLLISGGQIGSIVFFQIIELSLVIGYALSTLNKYISTKLTVVIMLFWVLNPLIIEYSVIPFKDVMFMIFAVLLSAYSLNIYFTDGKWFNKKINIAMYAFSVASIALVRHNGILYAAAFLLVPILYTDIKKALLIILCIALLTGGVKIPLYSALKVEKPEQRQTETLGLPMTVIGAVASEKPEALNEETKRFIYSVADKKAWENDYILGSFNVVKFDSKTNNNVIEEYGFKKVLPMMRDCFHTAPKEALMGLICLTNPLYGFLGLHSFAVISPYVEDNEIGIKQQGVDLLKKAERGYSSVVLVMFPHIFVYFGLLIYLLLILLLSKCRINRKSDIKKAIFVLPIFLYNFITMLLLSGYHDASRFFCYVFFVVPVTMIILICDKKPPAFSKAQAIK